MLGIQIVDASGRMVARVAAGPEHVKMLAPGYSLRHGLVGQPFQPARAVQRFTKFAARHPGVSGGDWTYGDRARYQLTGDEGLFGWDRYGGHAEYGVTGLPNSVVAQDALRSSSMRGLGAGLPMPVVAQDALRSSSMHGLGGDEGLFGPEDGETSDLF